MNNNVRRINRNKNIEYNKNNNNLKQQFFRWSPLPTRSF